MTKENQNSLENIPWERKVYIHVHSSPALSSLGTESVLINDVEKISIRIQILETYGNILLSQEGLWHCVEMKWLEFVKIDLTLSTSSDISVTFCEVIAALLLTFNNWKLIGLLSDFHQATCQPTTFRLFIVSHLSFLFETASGSLLDIRITIFIGKVFDEIVR